MKININKLNEYANNNNIYDDEHETVLEKYLQDERFREVVNNTKISYDEFCNWMSFEDMIKRKIKYETFAKIDRILWENEDICALDLIMKGGFYG